MENTPLLEATNTFYSSLLAGDFATVEDMLSPDCRIQDQLVGGRGANSIELCMEKLREVHSKSSKARVDMSMKKLALMRNKKQTRFLAQPKVAFITMTIGFALEWRSGIVVCIVICKDTNEASFLTDNTSAPVEVAPPPPPAPAPEPEPEPELEPEPIIKAAEQSQPSPVVAEETLPPVPVSSHNEVLQPVHSQPKPTTEKWYPGKLLGRRPSTSVDARKGAELMNAAAGTGRSNSTSLQYSGGAPLFPPYLVPQPPAIPPTLVVVILGCKNLKSRLNRVITRPINSYVTMRVGGAVRQTPVVHNSRDPVHNASDRYLFEIPPHEEYVYFTVRDKHMLDEDTLAEVSVPLASLKCRVASTDPATSLQLSLSLKERRFGKGLRAPIGGQEACLSVQLTKVDIMQWWVLEELRMRDEARERRIREEQEAKRKAQEEAKKQSEELERQNKLRGKTSASTKRPSMLSGPAVDCDGNAAVSIDTKAEKLNQWVDSSLVACCRSCGEEFTFFNRKHHCRVCGFVFCGDCTRGKVIIDGAPARACDDCSRASQAQLQPAQPIVQPLPSSTVSKPSATSDSVASVASVAKDLSRQSLQAVNRTDPNVPDSDDEDVDDVSGGAQLPKGNSSVVNDATTISAPDPTKFSSTRAVKDSEESPSMDYESDGEYDERDAACIIC